MKLPMAIGLGLALMGACANESTVQAGPTRPWSPAEGIPTRVELTCASDESVTLLTETVQPRPDGVQIRIVNELDEMELFLNEIGVMERFRRVGAGTALLEELKLLGQELGCTTVWVLTDEGNPAAMGMYAKAGGTWDGERHVMFEYDLLED